MEPTASVPPLAPTVRHGVIADYNEQGMESDVFLTFQDAAYMGARDWDRAGWFVLATGDQLTIHRPHGGVLWEGVFGARPRTLAGWVERWRHRHRRGWCPEEVPYETWLGWFQTRPYLRATFVPSAGSERGEAPTALASGSPPPAP